MFERFTERARQVVVLAQETARTNRCRYIGTEHILAGLVREEEGLAARILASMDASKEKVLEVVGRVNEPSETPIEGQIPFTPRTKRMLELALREALSLGHNYIGTEHILLGMVREYDSQAMKILEEDFKLKGEDIRNEVIRMLSGPEAPQVARNPKDSVEAKKSLPPTHPDRVESAVRETLKELLNMAVHLGRQYPDVPSGRIVKAVITLHENDE